jgi:hypothetical protein
MFLFAASAPPREPFLVFPVFPVLNRPCSPFANPVWISFKFFPNLGGMFEVIKTQIATAADKLTHLRRFL